MLIAHCAVLVGLKGQFNAEFWYELPCLEKCVTDSEKRTALLDIVYS